MKRLKLMLGLLVLAAVTVAFAGQLYRQGNTEPVEGVYRTVYLDTLILKSGDAYDKTITVPNNRVGYNLQVYLTDPYTREESLKTVITVNSVRGVTHADSLVHKWAGCNKFGYDNAVDSFYYHGQFSSATLSCTTSTAGADANDSLMCIWFMFLVDR